MAEENTFSEKRLDDMAVLTVQASELSSGVADALRSRVGQCLAREDVRKLVVDLTGVRFIDSVGLGGLVVLLRDIRRAGGRLALAGLTGHCRDVMEVTGLGKVFDTYEDVTAAAEALKRPG